ncbi:MAG: hypothetical protein JRF30_02915 [Deltaproteobacteria bacterium]|nr:hypothetical protein [Deltaproteobacteria bacterium]MBW2329887.1 hypothetical protein [Deltaproteobacteria bacterium]
MAEEKKICKITGIFHRGITDTIVEGLETVGIVDYQLAAARTLMLREKKGLFGLYSDTVIVEDPADIMSFLIPAEVEEAVMNLMIDKGDMETPGRGTVFSEEVSIVKAHRFCFENEVKPFEPKSTYHLITELTGICCIVQRGEGNFVARVALDTGTCVPGITFGHGTGLRDKLGLLRIAIPAEKEVINFAASKYDADAVMDLMIDAGKLDQPGKGFIYLYPIGKGLVNTKITRGMPKHAASMEQLIAAVDKIKGGTGWRRRTASEGQDSKSKRAFLNDLTNLILTCNAGRGEDLVKAAMDVGAAGATISKLKHQCPSDSELSEISPAREGCNMVVGKNQVGDIVETLDKAGAFDDNSHGQVLVSPIPKACTYLGK